MIKKIQQSKYITNVKLHQNVSDYYNQMRQSKTFQIDEARFTKDAQGKAKNMHEALLPMKFFKTKPQVKSKK